MFKGLIKTAEAVDDYGDEALAEDIRDVDIPVRKRWRQQLPAYIGGGLPGAIGSYVDPERAPIYGGIGGAAIGAKMRGIGGSHMLHRGVGRFLRRRFAPLAESASGMLPRSVQKAKSFKNIRGAAGSGSFRRMAVGAGLGTLGGMYSKKLFERSNPEAMDRFRDELAAGNDPRLVKG
jgi:hypothetical protein